MAHDAVLFDTDGVGTPPTARDRTWRFWDGTGATPLATSSGGKDPAWVPGREGWSTHRGSSGQTLGVVSGRYGYRPTLAIVGGRRDAD